MVGAQTMRLFALVYQILRFIFIFTRTRHLVQSWARRIHGLSKIRHPAPVPSV